MATPSPANAATVEELIAYYVRLLIIQYSLSPNAQAEIALLAQLFIANGIIFDVQNGFNIDASLGPTAIGAQLDIVGKYAGVDRFYSGINLTDFFSYITYSQVTSPPSSGQWGFNTYSTYNGNNHNGTLTYSGIIGVGNQLNDTSFLVLILLAILLNRSNFSDAQIDAALFEFFGDGIRAEDSGNMTMAFFIDEALTPLVSAIVAKDLLPVPMGVGASVVSGITGEMFAFTNYAGIESPFGYGFSVYANYGTLPGQMLTYSQITAG